MAGKSLFLWTCCFCAPPYQSNVYIVHSNLFVVVRPSKCIYIWTFNAIFMFSLTELAPGVPNKRNARAPRSHFCKSLPPKNDGGALYRINPQQKCPPAVGLAMIWWFRMSCSRGGVRRVYNIVLNAMADEFNDSNRFGVDFWRECGNVYKKNNYYALNHRNCLQNHLLQTP